MPDTVPLRRRVTIEYKDGIQYITVPIDEHWSYNQFILMVKGDNSRERLLEWVRRHALLELPSDRIIGIRAQEYGKLPPFQASKSMGAKMVACKTPGYRLVIELAQPGWEFEQAVRAMQPEIVITEAALPMTLDPRARKWLTETEKTPSLGA